MVSIIEEVTTEDGEKKQEQKMLAVPVHEVTRPCCFNNTCTSKGV
jgi:hypothetical protein